MHLGEKLHQKQTSWVEPDCPFSGKHSDLHRLLGRRAWFASYGGQLLGKSWTQMCLWQAWKKCAPWLWPVSKHKKMTSFDELDSDVLNELTITLNQILLTLLYPHGSQCKKQEWLHTEFGITCLLHKARTCLYLNQQAACAYRIYEESHGALVSLLLKNNEEVLHHLVLLSI